MSKLQSQASPIPEINVVQAAVGGRLEAEQTANYELEAGYRFNESLSVVGNVFYVQVDKPIIYTANTSDSGSDGYFNGTKLSSFGLEGELRCNRSEYSTSLGHSVYRAKDNAIDYVRGDEDRFLAAPAQKITASFNWHVIKNLDWNVNGF